MGWWGSSWARWARSQLGRGLCPKGWIRPYFLAEWVSRAGHEAQTRQTYVPQRGYVDFANGLGLGVCINGVDQERAGLMTKWAGLGEIQPGLNGTMNWGQISPIISPWRSTGFKWMQNNHISWLLSPYTPDRNFILSMAKTWFNMSHVIFCIFYDSLRQSPINHDP